MQEQDPIHWSDPLFTSKYFRKHTRRIPRADEGFLKKSLAFDVPQPLANALIISTLLLNNL
jgi:hypothetical protein